MDRLIFKGYLPFGGDQQLNQFVDRLGICRKDFLPKLEPFSERLVEHAKSASAKADAPYHYLQGRHSKEKLIDQSIRERKLTSGLIAVLCCQEHCRTVKLRYGEGRPRLTFAPRPQRVLYYYFLDPEFGRVHVRIQTWFPFTVQIYVNGHDWLAQQLAKKRPGFVQQDNCFTELDDPAAAQRQADRFFSLAWKSRLNRWAKQVNPLLQEVPWLRAMEYRWVIDQFELQHRRAVPLPPAFGGALSAALGSRRGPLLGPGHSQVPRPQAARQLPRGSAQPVPEGSPARRSHQAPDEEQLAEDVRQVRPGHPLGPCGWKP